MDVKSFITLATWFPPWKEQKNFRTGYVTCSQKLITQFHSYFNFQIHSSGNTFKGKYHCTNDLLFDWFGISCMTTDNFCFYLQNSLIQTSQTGGQQQRGTSPFSIPRTHIQHSNGDLGGGVALSSQQEKRNMIENHSLDDATVANGNFDIKLIFVIKKIQKNVFKLTQHYF